MFGLRVGCTTLHDQYCQLTPTFKCASHAVRNLVTLVAEQPPPSSSFAISALVTKV